MDEPGQSGQRRRLFLIKADDGTDRLIRLLGPFAAQSARITEIRLEGPGQPGEGQSILIEAIGVCEERAALIAGQLGALPWVSAIGLGWKSGRAAGDRPG